MESEGDVRLHFVNIDKYKVDLRSPYMEREGMVRSLDFLIEKQPDVVELITDSSSVAKLLGIVCCLVTWLLTYICPFY